MTLDELAGPRCPACGKSVHGGMWFEVPFARAFNRLVSGVAWLATVGVKKS